MDSQSAMALLTAHVSPKTLSDPIEVFSLQGEPQRESGIITSLQNFKHLHWIRGVRMSNSKAGIRHDWQNLADAIPQGSD